MIDLAEMIRYELQADPSLIRTVPLPPQITAVKQPSLERQRILLQFEPRIGLREGVQRVCAEQKRLIASATRREERVAEPAASPHPELLRVNAL
jgi:hypothetical protein